MTIGTRSEADTPTKAWSACMPPDEAEKYAYIITRVNRTLCPEKNSKEVSCDGTTDASQVTCILE